MVPRCWYSPRSTQSVNGSSDQMKCPRDVADSSIPHHLVIREVEQGSPFSLCGPALWIFVSSVSPSQVHAQQSSPAVVTIAYPNNGCQSRRKKNDENNCL